MQTLDTSAPVICAAYKFASGWSVLRQNRRNRRRRTSAAVQFAGKSTKTLTKLGRSPIRPSDERATWSLAASAGFSPPAANSPGRIQIVVVWIQCDWRRDDRRSCW